jgi:hypothetical protein
MPTMRRIDMGPSEQNYDGGVVVGIVLAIIFCFILGGVIAHGVKADRERIASETYNVSW